MAAVERDQISVMAARRIVTFAEAASIVGECDNAAIGEMQCGMQPRIPGQTCRFTHSRLSRLVWTDHNRRLPFQLLRNQKIRRYKFACLSLKSQFSQQMSPAFLVTDRARVERRF